MCDYLWTSLLNKDKNRTLLVSCDVIIDITPSAQWLSTRFLQKGILQHEFHLREKEEVTQWPDLEMTQGDDLE